MAPSSSADGAQPPNDQIRNFVLRSIRPNALEFLLERAEMRDLVVGETLIEVGSKLSHAIFPETGVTSIMSSTENERSVEKASIGREGYLGFPLALDVKDFVAPNRVVVQIAGRGRWIPVSAQLEAMDRFPCVRYAALHYAYGLISQIMQTVACASLHTASQRVCRWLLHAHDRCDGDGFWITQQTLSEILGLRRATVSHACSELQKARIIDYRRGAISFIDRAGAERHVCACYEEASKASRIPLDMAQLILK